MIGVWVLVLGLIAIALAGWWLYAYRQAGDARGATGVVSGRLAAIAIGALGSLVVVLEHGALVLSSIGDLIVAYTPWLANALTAAIGYVALDGSLDITATMFVGLVTGITVAAIMFRG